MVDGKLTDVVSAAGIPIGPTWHGRFFLGADSNGRDVAVRLLYGGRNSLEIGFIATLITMILATLIGVAAGYFRGVDDGVLSPRARPPVGLSRWCSSASRSASSLAIGGLNLGLFQLKGNSLMVPAVIIGVVYVPYVAKPIRGQVLGLREREFVDAARALGARQLPHHGSARSCRTWPRRSSSSSR